MPARHWTAGGLLPEADSIRSFDRRRGCRRDIRSTAGPDFWEALALPKSRSGRRNGFSSHGADRFEVRSFTSTSLADVRSGPDVFADALVPTPERAASGVSFPKKRLFDRRLPDFPGQAVSFGAMVIPLPRPQGKPLVTSATKPQHKRVSRKSRAGAPSVYLQPVHRTA